MKHNAIARIIIYSLLILLLLGLLIAGLSFDLFAFITGEISEEEIPGILASQGSADADLISKIQIDWAAGSIRIIPGDVDQITFAETEVAKDKNRLFWKRQGDTLKIQFSESNLFHLGISVDITKDLLITVPRNWDCEELTLNVASADVYIQDMTIAEVDFNGAAGICKFENTIVGDLSIDTASGDIYYFGTLDTLDCDAASADCTIIASNLPSRIDMDMASGDLDLTLPENEGFRVSLDTVSGDFFSEFPTSMSGDDFIYGNGNCHISVDAMSGDVNIRKSSAEPNPTISDNSF